MTIPRTYQSPRQAAALASDHIALSQRPCARACKKERHNVGSTRHKRPGGVGCRCKGRSALFWRSSRCCVMFCCLRFLYSLHARARVCELALHVQACVAAAASSAAPTPEPSGVRRNVAVTPISATASRSMAANAAWCSNRPAKERYASDARRCGVYARSAHRRRPPPWAPCHPCLPPRPSTSAPQPRPRRRGALRGA